MITTPNDIKSLKDNEVFVFGSNIAGIHGAGAAKLALTSFGAVSGMGFGHFGKSFAIPTKNAFIKTLPISEIKEYVDHFIWYAEQNKNLIFYVTKVGCGYAGYKPEDIAPLFKDAINHDNIILPIEFINIINE